MKIKTTRAIKLSSNQLHELLVKVLALPSTSTMSPDFRTEGDQRDEYQVFDGVTLTYSDENTIPLPA